MAFNNIHVEQTAMTTAVSRSSDVNTQIMDFEKQLTGISEMVKAVWGGRAKQAFDIKHNEIRQYMGINAQDASGISDGTSQALNHSVGADDASYAVIAAIQGH
jgi:uncharacterized protein YukE